MNIFTTKRWFWGGWHTRIILACLVLVSGCGMRSTHPVPALPADLPVTWAAETEIDRLPITTGLLEMIPG